MPLVVFWNVRGIVGRGAAMAASTSRDNVVMLSGYSADLMQEFFTMLRTGVFIDAYAEGQEPQPDPDKPPQQKTGIDTDKVIKHVENSPMYNRYIMPRRDRDSHRTTAPRMNRGDQIVHLFHLLMDALDA
jgi:hypothetical protein